MDLNPFFKSALRRAGHLRDRGQSALQTSIAKKALREECLFHSQRYLFSSFSCC